MQYESFYRWILVTLTCGCIFLLGAVLSSNTSFAYTTPSTISVTPSPTVISTATPLTKPTPTVIIISQPASSQGPSTTITIIGLIIAFFAFGVQAITLFLVYRYVKDTAAMATATRDSAGAAERTLQEMKNAREAESAPFVIVYFNFVFRMQTIYLVVENIGKSVARDIRLKFSPELQVSQISRKRIESNTLLNDRIKSLVPGYKIHIPFDFLNAYFQENLPTGYTIRVTYQGDKPLPEQTLEYDLDLGIFKVLDFITEKGLIDVDDTLRDLNSNFFRFTEDFKSIHQNLIEISNALNRGAMVRDYLQINQTDIDILTELREFVLFWELDYGKDADKLNKQYLFDLRNKCLLLKEELLNSIANSGSGEWQEEAKSIVVKLSKLGYMRLRYDGYVVAQSIQGHAIEDFNSLGDSIIEDITRLIKLIEEGNEPPTKVSNQIETDLPSSANDAGIPNEEM